MNPSLDNIPVLNDLLEKGDISKTTESTDSSDNATDELQQAIQQIITKHSALAVEEIMLEIQNQSAKN